MIKFKVSGLPVGKEEVKFNIKTKRAYKPNKTRWYFQQIQLIAKNYMQMNNLKMLEGAIHFELDIIFKKGKRDEPTTKPDTSNVLKTAEDALNKICYTDDSCIVSHRLGKWFGEEGIVFTVERVIGKDYNYKDEN